MTAYDPVGDGKPWGIPHPPSDPAADLDPAEEGASALAADPDDDALDGFASRQEQTAAVEAMARAAERDDDR